jgi:hypothetical protein
LSGGNTFENIIFASSGVQFSDSTIQTSAGINEATCNELYVSLTNSNTITGETIFDYENINIINELATSTDIQGTLINWNDINSTGRTNIINFSQNSGNGGLSLYNVSSTQPVTELFYSSRSQFQLYTPLSFSDTTQQNTAYIPQSVTAGSYTNSDITVNSEGQITTIANGTSSGISEATANSLYASLTNSNTITGETIFDYSNTNIINELATPTDTQGTLINWNETGGTGRTNIINFAQNSGNGGLSLYTVSSTQPVTELFYSS